MPYALFLYVAQPLLLLQSKSDLRNLSSAQKFNFLLGLSQG